MRSAQSRSRPLTQHICTYYLYVIKVVIRNTSELFIPYEHADITIYIYKLIAAYEPNTTGTHNFLKTDSHESGAFCPKVEHCNPGVPKCG